MPGTNSRVEERSRFHFGIDLCCVCKLAIQLYISASPFVVF